MARKLTRLHSRYHCTGCGIRVFPYDAIDRELGLEAPMVGKSGEAVLLSTLNSDPVKDSKGVYLKWAWCWACNTFVQCIRKTNAEIRMSYLNRHGISIRNRTSQRKAS